MNFTLRTIASSLATHLATPLPDVTFYEDPSQQSDYPCMFLQQRYAKTENKQGTRYLRTIGLDLTYLDDYNLTDLQDRYQSAAGVLDDVMELFNYVNGDYSAVLRTYDRQWEIDEDGLHYKFELRVWVYPEETGTPMNSMSQNIRAEKIEDLSFSVHPLPAGSMPTVTTTKDERGRYHVDLGIPRGDQGPEGPPGGDYILTEEDKEEIAGLAAPLVNKESIGLGNVDNTPDLEKPISNATQEALDDITEKIPAQASEQNQLADKEFVNSSIGTNTANYISNQGQPFTSLAQLESYTGTVTNNDYAFVTGIDEQGNTYFDRYKASVSGTSVSWAKEYRLNNSSFTAVQWAAITSGITGSLVEQISTNQNDIENLQDGKANKAPGAIEGHIAELDGSGNPTDSGKTFANTVENNANQVLTGQALWGYIVNGTDGYGRELTGTPNLNSVTKSGFYYVGGTNAQNVPAGVAKNGLLMVSGRNAARAIQLYNPYNEARLFYRLGLGGTWADWVELANTTQVNTKQDKDTDAVSGNVAVFDENGNTTDSGKLVDNTIENNANHIPNEQAIYNYIASGNGGASRSIVSTELDTIHKTGFFYGYTLTHSPQGADRSGYLINVHREIANSTYDLQIFSDSGASGLYYRKCSNGTWGAWVGLGTTTQLATKQDKDTDAVSGNLAMFDGNGQTVDGGIDADDVVLSNTVEQVQEVANPIMDLLWENPSPYANFAANTKVTIPTIGDYNVFIIQHIYRANVETNKWVASNIFIRGITPYECLFSYGSVCRRFNFQNDGILFGDPNDVSYAIPYRIYGIKGTIRDLT